MLLKEIEEITRARDLYKQQSERKSLELTQKNVELIQKIEQLDNLNIVYQESLNNIHILEAALLERLQNEEILIQ
ncbi:hypothetical protein IMG5_147980 [Ichthyophthirius multifiliis]|uniref:Uncharacterized protein n=1 Tax=Ichthyophthirius multifiliis TaxID=5932 RepID=G0QY75_ICHMU|nr:hypothetical protein IMG5_147980 [Ichthyophthirius multifiliis]EGR29814.1 hypothetical protein IMG5_147980 [Ichthyophthirius multifiliis]|eukprot:XP_004031050.1 hypothetical protein IMG5_147980 [Ichthyophthirius multifiliis]